MLQTAAKPSEQHSPVSTPNGVRQAFDDATAVPILERKQDAEPENETDPSGAMQMAPHHDTKTTQTVTAEDEERTVQSMSATALPQEVTGGELEKASAPMKPITSAYGTYPNLSPGDFVKVSDATGKHEAQLLQLDGLYATVAWLFSQHGSHVNGRVIWPKEAAGKFLVSTEIQPIPLNAVERWSANGTVCETWHLRFNAKSRKFLKRKGPLSYVQRPLKLS